MGKQGNVGRLLFVRHTAFGDVLFTTPFSRLLKTSNPDLQIDLLSTIGSVNGFERWISLTQISPRQALGMGHERIYWFYYEHDPTLHILDGYELSTGLHLEDRTLQWKVEGEERTKAEDMLAGWPRPLIAFSPVCAHMLRSLPLWKIQGVVDWIHKALGATIVLTSDRPLEVQGCLNLTNQLGSMRELAAVISLCDALVTVDSGPLHLAQALSVPAVGLFGCTLPELRATRPSHLGIVRNESLTCLGCYHTAEKGAESLLACARGDLACMETLDESAILRSLESVLQHSPDPILQARIAAYESYRRERIRDLPGDYATLAIREYRSRIERYNRYFTPLKRIERRFRKWRKRLWPRANS